MAKKDEISFEIINHIGDVKEEAKGWKMEVNRVSWNLAEPKYDIRSWSPDHTKMGKGITLTEEDLRALAKVINAEVEYLDSDN